MKATVQSSPRLDGSLRMPGDKSISHRALILGALAQGRQTIRGLPLSRDVASTSTCLRALGCHIEKLPNGDVAVQAGEWRKGQLLDAGNSGTTARLLAGLIAGKGLQCAIDGDSSLRQRPMQRIADPLMKMGAIIRTHDGGRLPMSIHGERLTGITYRPAVASAQVKSAILIAGLFAEGGTAVIEPAPTRDHTENMLEAMGVPVLRGGNTISIAEGAALQGIRVEVPGDISSAAFFLAAACIHPDAEIVLTGTGINPTRSGFVQVLERMGAEIETKHLTSCAREDIADLLARTSRLHGVTVGGTAIPTLIDELPVLAVVATQAEGVTTVSGAEELRHKESDRIAATVSNLQKLGADIRERPDGFVVTGPCKLTGASVSSFGDHRIAMAMAVAGLVASGETCIEGSEAVSVSYPGFFDDLRQLTRTGGVTS